MDRATLSNFCEILIVAMVGFALIMGMYSYGNFLYTGMTEPCKEAITQWNETNTNHQISTEHMPDYDMINYNT